MTHFYKNTSNNQIISNNQSIVETLAQNTNRPLKLLASGFGTTIQPSFPQNIDELPNNPLGDYVIAKFSGDVDINQLLQDINSSLGLNEQPNGYSQYHTIDLYHTGLRTLPAQYALYPTIQNNQKMWVFVMPISVSIPISQIPLLSMRAFSMFFSMSMLKSDAQLTMPDSRLFDGHEIFQTNGGALDLNPLIWNNFNQDVSQGHTKQDNPFEIYTQSVTKTFENATDRATITSDEQTVHGMLNATVKAGHNKFYKYQLYRLVARGLSLTPWTKLDSPDWTNNTDNGFDKDHFVQIYQKLLHLDHYINESIQAADNPQSVTAPLQNWFDVFEKPTLHNDKQKTVMNYVIEQLRLKKVEPDDKMKALDAVNILWDILTVKKLKGANANDFDSLYVADKYRGYWAPLNDVFSAIVAKVIPTPSPTIIARCKTEFNSRVASTGDELTPHNQSDALLFTNGALSITEQGYHLYPLDSAFTRNHQFMAFQQIQRPFVENPKLPVFEHASLDGSDWTPLKLLDYYGNHDPEKTRVFLFLYSLGLFPGHNFGVNVSVKGPSGVGKSFGMNLLSKLLPNETVYKGNYNALNQHFGFTNVTKSTGLVMLSECNYNVDKLSADGVITYDKFADNAFSAFTKGKNDVTPYCSPQLYVEGTSLIQSDSLNTGPYRRTLAYIMHNPTAEEKQSNFTTRLNAMMNNDDVLDWFLFQLIKAYRDTIPVELRGDFSLVTDSSNKSMIDKLFPAFEQEWRNELLKSNNSTDDFLMDYVMPYVHVAKNENDMKQATALHVSMLYNLIYIPAYKENHPTDAMFLKYSLSPDRFATEITQFLTKQHMVQVPIGSQGQNQADRHRAPRFKMLSPNATGFDWAKFNDDYHNGQPQAILLNPSNYPAPFGKKVQGWFKIQAV